MYDVIAVQIFVPPDNVRIRLGNEDRCPRTAGSMLVLNDDDDDNVNTGSDGGTA